MDQLECYLPVMCRYIYNHNEPEQTPAPAAFHHLVASLRLANLEKSGFFAQRLVHAKQLEKHDPPSLVSEWRQGDSDHNGTVWG